MEPYWEINPAFKDLLQQLKRAKIIFSNSQEAAAHVNRIWESPDTWWNQSKTRHAREAFFDMCGRVKTNWLQEWVSFFKQEIKQSPTTKK
jgi:putative transferase (TIGR04331 family)